MPSTFLADGCLASRTGTTQGARLGIRSSTVDAISRVDVTLSRPAALEFYLAARSTGGTISVPTRVFAIGLVSA